MCSTGLPFSGVGFELLLHDAATVPTETATAIALRRDFDSFIGMIGDAK